MRKILLLTFTIFSFFFFQNSDIKAQSCVPTNLNNTTINLSCGASCTTINFKVPHIKSTSTYTISNIPYTPFTYIVPTGSEDVNLYDDDFYSSAVTLPFTFCFFDSSFNKVVVGSNGLLTFDETNASCDNAYEINNTIPSAGTDIQCSQFDEYYPKAAIMGAFSDLYPTITGSPPGMKIQWRAEGTAPCRRFVVSFYQIGTFGANSCAAFTPNTFQIVLYESTGLIDIYFENKSCVATTSNGRGILGIQNWARNQAVWAVGKNNTNWTAANEAYRFTPSGGTSKFVSSELLSMAGTILATADTVTTAAGLLDISFPNICPPPGATQYVVRTTFGSCLVGTNMVSLDTIKLIRNNTLPVTTVLTPTNCGTNTGSITVNVTTGMGTAPYQYSLNAGTLQPSNVFTGLAAGSYTIYATDATGCDTTYQVNIISNGSLTATFTSTNVSCPGLNNGSITVTPTSGTAPFTFSANGGPGQPGGSFINLAADTYTIVYTDALFCTGSVMIVITSGPAIVGTATTIATSCPTVNDGTVTVNTPAGPGNTYTLNPGAVSNTTGIFTGLAPNTYTVTFVTASGCTGSVAPNPVVTTGPFLTSTFTQVNPVCVNISDGSISIIPQAGTSAPYNITLTGPGGPYTLTGNAPVVFTNLAPGTYNYSFSSANGCTGTGGPVVLTTNSSIMVPATLTMPLCNGNANGSITFNPFGGVAPFQYSINGGVTFQASNTFNSLLAGDHTFLIMDNVGCTRDTTITLTQPAILTSSASNNTTAGCSNNDGTIMATAVGGTIPYAYTISGPTVNTTGASNGIFTGLATGNYTVTITDAKGCFASSNTTVILVDNMFLTPEADVTICVGSSATFNPQTNPETSVFLWRSSNAAASTIANASIKNATVTPTDTATYILNAKWGTCVREDTINVNVLHKPVPNAGKDTAICNISYAILRGSASNLSGTVNYDWSPVTNVEFPTQAVTRVYPAGNDTTYTYTLTVTDNYSCNFSVTDQVNVRVQPPVPAYAGNDTIAVKGVPHQLFGSGADDYLWSPSYPLNNASNPNPLATLENDTRFILQVTDFAGCIGYDTVFVKVYFGPTYYIPNAFSPNGDGLNDIFRAIPVGIVNTEWFRIFNRYGEMVFQTNQWLKGWDGTYQGKKQPIGAYIWIIKGTDRNGKAVEMKGTVMLVQ